MAESLHPRSLVCLNGTPLLVAMAHCLLSFTQDDEFVVGRNIARNSYTFSISLHATVDAQTVTLARGASSLTPKQADAVAFAREAVQEAYDSTEE